MRQFVTGVTLANEAGLIRSAELSVPVVLVESARDARVYKRFFVPDPHLRLIYTPGKSNLLDAMRFIGRRGTSGTFGICDSDYSLLLGDSLQPGVVTTDQRDLEVTIVCSDAFPAVLAELLDPSEGRDELGQHPDSVREHLLSLVEPIGQVRLYAAAEGVRLRFLDVDLGAFLSGEESLDWEAYLHDLVSASPGASCSVSVLKDIADSGYMAVPAAEVASGHDLSSVLDAYTALATGRPRRGRSTVESMLRLAFDPDCFARTSMARRIGEWEAASGFAVLRDDSLPGSVGFGGDQGA